MMTFIKSRAGKQFVLLVVAASCIWLFGLMLHEPLFRVLLGWNTNLVGLAILTVTVTGGASFIYSALRIYDLRKEMMLRLQSEKHADYLATHDHLTKLPNRYAFERARIHEKRAVEDEEHRTPNTLTVFSLDLDGFKKVNDLVGHQGGDMLLKQVAKRLCILAGYDCVFRFGGDEFIIIARGLPREKVSRFAELAIQTITKPIMIGNIPAEVGASVGCAHWPDHGDTIEAISHKADIALYEAKASGQNKFVEFHEALQEKAQSRALFEGRLRRAVENGDIRPYYQPLIDLHSGKVCGFEALARWTNEDGVKVSPMQFISVAEETGLITDLFRHLLRESCRDALAWPDEIVLSFNISPVQMEDRLLATRILEILNEAGLPPHRLEVEITENALIQDSDLAASILEDLHEAGIQIALDDFGTGYSSLSQLARYKFDKIKIDKSFVNAFRNDERQKKVVDAMLVLGRNLNLKMTVEGLEENTQLSYFITHGCDIGQGYLFGQAMAAPAALEFLDSRGKILAKGDSSAA